MTKLLSAALVGAILIGFGVESAPAAQDAKKAKDPERAFQKRDQDGDMALSLAEYRGKGKKDPAKAERKFKKLDRDGDEKVTLAEFKAGRKKAK